MIFASWQDIGRVLLVGTLAYVALVALLRVSGKRTLSKMNAFDLIVTIALGSTLATVLLSKDVALLEGLAALALLVALQFVAAWIAKRSRRFESLIKSDPALLFYDGAFLDASLLRERITHSEVRAAVRAQGIASLDSVQAVVLETDGSIAIVKESGTSHPTALADLDPPPPPRRGPPPAAS
ncbi:DUF421 domain-containing protein [soil metagenome]